jgi:restriction system protein
MARRRKSSGAEDFIDVLALLPWWAAVALGVSAYVVMQALAVPPGMTGSRPGDLPLVRMMIAGLATAGQYVLPLLCFIAAGVSAYRRHQRTSLADKAAGSSAAEAVRDMSWREFEMLLGETFRRDGYAVQEQGGNGPDGGVDLRLRKDDETYLVQCKHWKAFKVDVSVVRELYGLMAAQGASGGYVVSSGSFTAPALEFASGRNIRLVDGPKVLAMLQREARAKQPVVAEPAAVPACPKCQSPMVRRTATKGVNAGNDFWGCSRYPACRGTLQAHPS